MTRKSYIIDCPNCTEKFSAEWVNQLVESLENKLKKYESHVNNLNEIILKMDNK